MDGLKNKLQNACLETNKIKKKLNILRCLSGVKWGTSSQSLKRLYKAAIRSDIDYGSIMVYSSANKTWITKIETTQTQAMRVCCRPFRYLDNQ